MLPTPEPRQASMAPETYRGAIAESMRRALTEHRETILFGQGVDDHKGTFGTTLGLADEFGTDRVFDVPLAEEGMMGVAIGAALGGLYPIQTHIRNDFVLLATNQLVNLASKYRYMFGGRFEVPMLVRGVVGRSWGQGAQHSQSLQATFAHFPGLRVVMPADPVAVRAEYEYAVAEHRGPVLALEHRLLYDLRFADGVASPRASAAPPTTRIVRAGRDVTVVATSIMVLESLRAAAHLESAGIDCEVLDLHCVSHPDVDLVCESVARTGRLVVADTSWPAYGVCAEVCRWIVEREPRWLEAPAVSVGMQPAPCPPAKALEDRNNPNLGVLCDAIARMVRGCADHGVELPDETSMADVYKRFKGPF